MKYIFESREKYENKHKRSVMSEKDNLLEQAHVWSKPTNHLFPSLFAAENN
jgi:hypothetical protein